MPPLTARSLKNIPMNPSNNGCACSLEWTTTLLGSVPDRSHDLAAIRPSLSIWLVFGPCVAFAGIMMTWAGARAYVANNPGGSTTIHMLSLSGILLCCPHILADSSCQIFGLLAKRTGPSGNWLTFSSYVGRLANLAALMFAIVAACNADTFLTTWTTSGTGCETAMAQSLSLLPLISTALQLFVLSILLVQLVLVKLRHHLPVGILFHVSLILTLLGLHYVWRLLRDWSAFSTFRAGWTTRSFFSARELSVSSCRGAEVIGIDSRARNEIIWSKVGRYVSRAGVDSPVMLYMLGIFPLLTKQEDTLRADLQLCDGPDRNGQDRRSGRRCRWRSRGR
ncbi:hypothetical protein BCV70DRAFT_100263 [Testicularia cyperi]|uniref:Uncharacterized protein n=1 Tax=Testicularia cyperi TaxID=1882483 RepID=A0A317XQV6_9BASI|nr:hypothetical protein BCV70DRAFT_100263 [Testicularia cyperi]